MRIRKVIRAAAIFAAALAVTAAPARFSEKHETGLLWKATSDKGTVYLLGTIRLGSNGLYPLPKLVEDAFESAPTLIVALDPSADDLRIEEFMDRHGAYPDGDNVYKHLRPDYAAKLKTLATSAGLPVENLGSLRPWVVLMVTGMWPLISGSKQPGVGMEEHFIQRAKGRKTILQIETAELQLELLASIPDKLQLDILDDSLDHPVDSKLVAEAGRAWLRGDAKTVEEDEVGFLARHPEVRRRLLDDRSATMAEFAESRLKAGGRYFMAVAAPHLLGRDGIVNRLRRMGYRVTAEQ